MVINKKKYIENIKKIHKAYGFTENIDIFVNRYVTLQERRGHKFV